MLLIILEANIRFFESLKTVITVLVIPSFTNLAISTKYSVNLSLLLIILLTGESKKNDGSIKPITSAIALIVCKTPHKTLARSMIMIDVAFSLEESGIPFIMGSTIPVLTKPAI